MLCFLLGGIGAHNYYLGQADYGLLKTIFFWTWIPEIISWIELIWLLSLTTEEFDEKYNGKH